MPRYELLWVGSPERSHADPSSFRSEVTMSNPRAEELRSLQTIVGEKLSSVEFVMDYVQLRFDGPTLTAVSHPVVKTTTAVLRWDDPGYRDALCGQITAHVASVDIRDRDELKVLFDNGVSVAVSLKEDDQVGAEAVRFDTMRGHWFVL